jgi:GNAT superfamily N-acetyltransferase
MLTIRPATQADVPLVLSFIQELGEFHGLQEPCGATEEGLARHLAGPTPLLHAELAFVDGRPAGQALWHPNFPSWEGRPGIYLEDLWVRPEFRGLGLGRALLVHLADLAVREGWGQMVWQAVDWNAAGIAFYESVGAWALQGWQTFKLEGEALQELARRKG